MRGLKHTKDADNRIQYQVASFTDAWIETQAAKRRIMQARVASFTDAWIETCYYGDRNYWLCVASFTDAWIETVIPSFEPTVASQSHLLQMRGLKLY